MPGSAFWWMLHKANVALVQQRPLCVLWSFCGPHSRYLAQGESEEARRVYPCPWGPPTSALGYSGADCPSCAGN